MHTRSADWKLLRESNAFIRRRLTNLWMENSSKQPTNQSSKTNNKIHKAKGEKSIIRRAGFNVQTASAIQELDGIKWKSNAAVRSDITWDISACRSQLLHQLCFVLSICFRFPIPAFLTHSVIVKHDPNLTHFALRFVLQIITKNKRYMLSRADIRNTLRFTKLKIK